MLVGDTTRLAPLATQVELAEALGQQIVEGQSRLGPIHLHGGADRLDRLVEIIGDQGVLVRASPHLTSLARGYGLPLGQALPFSCGIR